MAAGLSKLVAYLTDYLKSATTSPEKRCVSTSTSAKLLSKVAKQHLAEKTKMTIMLTLWKSSMKKAFHHRKSSTSSSMKNHFRMKTTSMLKLCGKHSTWKPWESIMIYTDYKSDFLLLADVFENSRKVCMKSNTAPGLSCDEKNWSWAGPSYRHWYGYDDWERNQRWSVNDFCEVC